MVVELRLWQVSFHLDNAVVAWLEHHSNDMVVIEIVEYDVCSGGSYLCHDDDDAVDGESWNTKRVYHKFANNYWYGPRLDRMMVSVEDVLVVHDAGDR